MLRPDPLASLVSQFISSLPPNAQSNDSTIDQKIQAFIQVHHSDFGTSQQQQKFKERVVRTLESQTPSISSGFFLEGSAKNPSSVFDLESEGISPQPVEPDEKLEDSSRKMERESISPQRRDLSPSPFISSPTPRFSATAAASSQTPSRTKEEREELTPERIKSLSLEEMQALKPKDIERLTKEGVEALMGKYKEIREEGESPLQKATFSALGDLRDKLRKIPKQAQAAEGEQTTPTRSTPSRGMSPLEKLELKYEALCFFSDLPEKVSKALQLYGVNPENFDVKGDFTFDTSAAKQQQLLKKLPLTQEDIAKIKKQNEENRKSAVQDCIAAGWAQLAFLMEKAVVYANPLTPYNRQLKNNLEAFLDYLKSNSVSCNLLVSEKGKAILEELKRFQPAAKSLASQLEEAISEAKQASVEKKLNPDA